MTDTVDVTVTLPRDVVEDIALHWKNKKSEEGLFRLAQAVAKACRAALEAEAARAKPETCGVRHRRT